MSARRTVDVRVISKCTMKPLYQTPESEKPFYLTPWDLLALNFEYAQLGLLFTKPKPPHDHSMQSILDRLKSSLSATLTHFYPLAGRLSTQHPGRVSVLLSDLSGAEFIYAVADTTSVSDILNPDDVPHIIFRSLFPLDSWALNNQGHTTPLLVVQVTQLIDGIFIACSMNHALADGASFWHFLNSWSEICRSSQHTSVISRPPVTTRWFSNNQDYNILASHAEDESIFQFEPPTHPPEAYRRRVFSFTSKSIASLKAKANLECNTDKISSYQALAALVWRSITRVRGLPPHHTTTCMVPIDCRPRLEPPLSETYFGNSIISEFVSTTVGELLGNNLGWTARTLHNQIVSYNDNKVRSNLEQPAPYAYSIGDPGFVFFGSSPRFDVYGNDFGWGKPVGVEWYSGAVDGTVYWFPGREKGSVDLIIYLFSEFMNAIQLDDEFMDAVSPAPVRSKDADRHRKNCNRQKCKTISKM